MISAKEHRSSHGGSHKLADAYEQAHKKHTDYASKLSNKEYDESELDSGDDFDIDFNVGDKVRVPRNLTTDPVNKQGEEGKVYAVNKNYITVKFKDGVIGRYDQDALESI